MAEHRLLSGRSALVAGAGSGRGCAMARTLAAADVRLAAADKDDVADVVVFLFSG